MCFKLILKKILTEIIKIKAYSMRLKLYGLYLLAVKTLCRKFTKFSPRIGQPTETRCFQIHFQFNSLDLAILTNKAG
jgi:hypothetical protein